MNRFFLGALDLRFLLFLRRWMKLYFDREHLSSNHCSESHQYARDMENKLLAEWVNLLLLLLFLLSFTIFVVKIIKDLELCDRQRGVRQVLFVDTN